MTTEIFTGRPRLLRLGALIDAWIARDTHRRQLRQLARLEDHLLRDIGVTRDDVRRLSLR